MSFPSSYGHCLYSAKEFNATDSTKKVRLCYAARVKEINQAEASDRRVSENQALGRRTKYETDISQ
jgi:hypothetical protein